MNILIVNGSPKGKFSITLQTGKYLELLYPEHKFEVIHAGQIIKKLQRDFTPVKEMLEQIVAKLGIPPFLLGLSWSTTERMAAQQTDLLTSELWYYRGILTPIIKKILNEFLKREGYESNYEIVWDSISLQDEVEEARARLLRAQAQTLEKGLKGEEN
jgi:hypothetical protein